MNLDISRRVGVSYPIEIKKVIESALNELGLDYRYLKEALNLSQDKITDIEADKLSAYSWIAICNSLHLQYDTCQWGYNQRSHHGMLYQAWIKKELALPFTHKVEALINGFEKRKKEDGELFVVGLRTMAADYFKYETSVQSRTPTNL